MTVIIDLTPVRDGTGTARLPDMVEGRSKQVFAAWLQARPEAWWDGIEVVAMDGFTGFKTAAAEHLPDAVPLLDPFHAVLQLGGTCWTGAASTCSRRPWATAGRKGDPLYGIRRTLHTGTGLLTVKQQARLDAVFAGDAHVQVEATRRIDQRMIDADPDRVAGEKILRTLINALSHDVPQAS